MSAKTKKIVFRISMSIIMILVSLILWVGIDVVIGVMKKDAPRRPIEPLNVSALDNLIWLYSNPLKTHPDIPFTYNDITSELVLSNIADTVTYINGRYDCSDFRAINLLKLYYVGGNDLLSLSEDVSNTIKDTLTGFKFWITSSGKDSMCYHSENHEVLFAVIEYLTGMIYPDELFSIDNKSGIEHMAIAKERLLTWLELRFDYGFSEYYSSNYLPVDIAAISMLLQYGDHSDTELMTKSAIIMDLIFYDYASQLYDYVFLTPNGRSYDRNNASVYEEASSLKIIDYVWNLGNIDYDNIISYGHAMLFVDMMRSTNINTGEPFYIVPQVIIDIGNDSGKRVNKASTGLNLSELAEEDLIGLNDRQLMYLLGMGAKSNPEIINNNLDMMNEYDLWSNDFLSNFKFINIKLFRLLGIMPTLMDKFNPSTHGSAIERGNIYSYITNDYKLSTNQAYHPGSFGDQQTLSIATLPNGVSVYTTHPFRDDKLGTTPGYWAGYGVAPHSAQDENISISIYDIPKNKIFLAPNDTLQYTHTLFPEELLDEVIINGKYAFGRIEDTYIALIAGNDLHYKDYDQSHVDIMKLPVSDTSKRFDLIQKGENNQYWIYELGSSNDDGTFSEFMTRIQGNSIDYNDNTKCLTYISNSKTLRLNYNGDFLINNAIKNLEYKRYESQYIIAERKPSELTFEFNGYTLYHNFDNLERQIG